MVTDIVRKVEQWTYEKEMPEKQRDEFITYAQMYQRGETLPPKEEELIASIVKDDQQTR